jgi:hypothetical protein
MLCKNSKSQDGYQTLQAAGVAVDPWRAAPGQKRTFAKTSQQTDYFLAMTLPATKSNWVKEDHWHESHLVAGNGRLIWHQYMESSS